MGGCKLTAHDARRIPRSALQPPVRYAPEAGVRGVPFPAVRQLRLQPQRDAAGRVVDVAGAWRGRALRRRGVSFAGHNYAHRMKRNRTTFHDEVSYKTIPSVQRLSHRLLARVVESVHSEEHAIFCEMRAPTICAAAFGGKYPFHAARPPPGSAPGAPPPCRFGRLQKFGPRRCFSPAVFSWLAVVNSELVANATSPTFFHRLKGSAAEGVHMMRGGARGEVGRAW